MERNPSSTKLVIVTIFCYDPVIMNEHLKPIFEKVLPAIENLKIDYWVYGGVAVASMRGDWIRFNQDVDTAVMEKDFEKTAAILMNLAYINKWRTRVTDFRGRPKLDLYPNIGQENFSLIPLYKINNQVEFKFGYKIRLPESVMLREKRTIKNHSFFTFKDEYIRQLLMHYLRHNKVGKEDKHIRDALEILDKDEISELVPLL